MRRIPIVVGGATAMLLGVAAAPATASMTATGGVTATASPASHRGELDLFDPGNRRCGDRSPGLE